MNTIVIRCDSSIYIGSGHVYRSRTLARDLRCLGFDVIFLCRPHVGSLINILKSEFKVLELPVHSAVNPIGLQGRDFYSACLASTQEEDAVQCVALLQAAQVKNIKWLIVDHYGLDIVWEKQILEGLSHSNSSIAPRLFVIDDLADRIHCADLLLDQNFVGTTTNNDRYKQLVSPSCSQLLGPHYALLPPIYSQLQPSLTARGKCSRVLVFFGGVDSAGCTLKALKALSYPDLSHLEVDVVIGSQCHCREHVLDLVNCRPLTNLYSPLPTLAGLITRADLSVGAAGTAMLERLVLGLPSLVITTAENQVPFIKPLSQHNFIDYIGTAEKVSVDDLHSKIKNSLIRYPSQLSGQCLTDCFGVRRVSIALTGSVDDLVLRPVQPSDEALLLRWANDPTVRINSFSPESITPDTHHSWFSSRLTSEDCLHLIASDPLGCPIGQIRFDRNLSEKTVLVDLSLDRCARGFGLASHLILRGLKLMEHQWGTGMLVLANVLAQNQASQASFARAGFILDSHSSDPLITQWHWRST